jgi:hypothetical protein
MDLDDLGLIALFEALGAPCECEKGITHDDRGYVIRECANNPFPKPGHRWYRELVDGPPATDTYIQAKSQFRGNPIREFMPVAA